MSTDVDWNDDSEEWWAATEEQKRGISAIRILAVVIIAILFLILSGAPIDNPILFGIAVAYLTLIFLIDGLCNRELVRGLRGKS